MLRGNMKKRFLFVFALLSVLMITGCRDNEKKLGTLSSPQEVTVQSDGNKSLIIFDEVENAEYYNIYINDMSVTVKSTGSGTIQFDASKIITLPQTYTIKVKAGGDKYFDSKFTEEYKYTYTKVLSAPVIAVDGTTLNWNKVDNAEFYDVVVTTANPTMETKNRFQTNTFNFSNILVNKGEYVFKVRAVSENSEYLPSIYSNQVTYTHTITLTTPYNLATNYDVDSGERLLSFVSSENVDNFTLNINGINYTLTQNELNSFLKPDDLDNVYILKLTSFINAKGISINNSQLLNISVKANASGKYFNGSAFSNTIACKFVSVLSTPQITLSTTTTVGKINITSTNSNYLSGFAIYLNDEKYKTVTKEVTQIELPLSEIGTAGIRVQAISNNTNCYSSQLSNVTYIDSSMPQLDSTSINLENGKLSWNSVPNATRYYVEIVNSVFRYAKFVTLTELDLSTVCQPNNYQVRVIALASGYKQSETTKDIQYTTKLPALENVVITSMADSTYLTFDSVDNCYGYVIYLNDVMVNHLFTTNTIYITAYISDANSYNIKVQAINVINSAEQDSEISGEQLLQNVRTLSSPILTIEKVGEKYYLNVNVNESEGALASGYEVWINYISIGEHTFQDNQIDITSYFANAGQYSFMVKAKAIDNNLYIKDSAISSITYTCTKQLDTVSDINVTALKDEGVYILTFKEQTLAAKYIVTILKADDETYNVEFELSSGVADISEYVKANGVYRIYVKAMALEGGFYTDSASSGNPYRLTKGETLASVENINVTKRSGSSSNGEIDVTWNKVANSSGYQVYVYYNSYGKNVLKKSIYVEQSDTPTLDIGSGEYLCLNKEGLYTIQIKALGNGNEYETSQISSYPYTYTMQSAIDFERNTISMYGNTYNYKIGDIEDLQHLLWYHYLYNQDVWMYNTLEYNLKVYCAVDLDTLAGQISESVADSVSGLTSNALKMRAIANTLLQQYPEMGAWSLGAGDESKFCLNEEKNIYIFRYEDALNKVKTDTLETTNQVYKEKLEIIDTFDQRSSNYVFAIDTKESVDVTTTEQLFTALQYNQSPNFVGDSAVAKAVYENARFILRQICSDAMSEYEKTLQIFNFLTKRVAYNTSITMGDVDDEILLDDNTYTMLGNLKDLYAEGILYNDLSTNGLYTSLDEVTNKTATSQSLSKVFVMLCSIEGIDSIKVDGTKDGEKHSWNKVYIDIEDDGYDGKQWYTVDLASAIDYTIDVTKSNKTTTYQLGLHKYFLISDTTLNAQATTWHKRLGDTTDYKASIDFDYYENERYSCVYNSNTLVANQNYKVKTAEDVKYALMHAMLKANKKHRVIVDIDAETYIKGVTGGFENAEALTTISSNITNTIYENARLELGGQYNCQVSVTIIDYKYIVLAVESVNYNG